ncbi:sce7726 family protein [Sorangium cellulosum]|uniref:sce7726 family protein n=1 Tax=Sorangium cellulosum TaxID=56 RepID=UPI0012FFA2A6|nr:sce7726 family protein [Sorangium cellulosum]
MIRNIHHTGQSTYLSAAFREARADELFGRSTTLLTAVQAIFDLMRRRYRSDYVYRAAIANKIFLGRHSPATTTLLSELRVWRSKADLAMLNGTSTVYEIKTELDNLDRLSSQLADYSRMFDRTYVVTHDGQAQPLQSVLPSHVGVIVLSKSFTLQVVREASSNADNIDILTVVDALRRSELVEMTRALCGSVPQVPSVRLVAECRQLLSQHQARSVHREMVRLLKKRRAFMRDDFRSVPEELVPAYLESGVSVSEWSAITDRLSGTCIGEIMDT